MQQYLALTIIAPQDSGILKQIAEACAQYQCQIMESRLSAAGENQIMMMYISGNWSAIAKLETPLAALGNQPNVHFKMMRTEMQSHHNSLVPYIVHITSVSSPHTLNQLLSFFNANKIKVSELAVTQYFANKTQASMQTIVITVLLSTETHLADLRENFILFCDEYNLDAIFEPDRQ
ncbi:MAG: Glycine cleavage system regulatory protein [Gammaproteobacteria bacterium]|jgi:glycine cleavage system transcriptional repressor|nr:Glycine cleavage system regulatory protein [Gammaproteobacteria bacterium]